MRNQKLFYGSSYDRGVDILLKLWPKIIDQYPKATLDICYGWDLFIVGYKDNPERLNWMGRISELMKQPGITHHGRIGKKELIDIERSCGIWVYPTYFTEINCITALETQANGLVPVTVDSFALSETVGAGVKVKGDIYDEETQEEWIKGLFEIMSSEEKWEEESKKAQLFSQGYTWPLIAKQWVGYFV